MKTSGGPSPRSRVLSTFLVIAALTATTNLFAGSASAQRGSSDGNYPETGPSSTTTLPVDIDPSPYPTTAPSTTLPPPTTAPIVTIPPTTTAPATTTTTTLAPLPLVRYGVVDEHATLRLDVSHRGAESHTLLTSHDGVEVLTGGVLIWTPGEDDGGTTVRLTVAADDLDGSTTRIAVTILVEETNSPPEIDNSSTMIAFPGKAFERQLTAIDVDTPTAHEIVRWTVDGPSGMKMSGDTLTWTPAEDHEPGIIEVTVTATDNGVPAATATATLTFEVIDTSEAALLAVDADGEPVNPFVIGATENAAAFIVDLAEPGQLLVQLAARTPSAVPDSSAGTLEVATTTLERVAVVRSVQQTFSALLALEVPQTAIAGGLAWQFILMAAPGLFSRRRGLFDIDGLAPASQIGDGNWFFRGNALGLQAGGRRWHDGRWMRRVLSPGGSVWIPTANLRSVRQRR